MYSDKVSAQFYSVRTNLVGLGTGNLNVEGSMAFSTHWSAHLPVQYNPFRLWDDGKLKNFTVQPGVRYWMRETYGRGCFIGLHGVFSIYNAGGLFDIATVTKAQLSAAGFLRGWCAPFRVAGIWSSNWVSVLSGPTGNVTVA